MGRWWQARDTEISKTGFNSCWEISVAALISGLTEPLTRLHMRRKEDALHKLRSTPPREVPSTARWVMGQEPAPPRRKYIIIMGHSGPPKDLHQSILRVRKTYPSSITGLVQRGFLLPRERWGLCSWFSLRKLLGYTKLTSKQLFSVYSLSQLLNHKHSHQDIANATHKQIPSNRRKQFKKKN